MAETAAGLVGRAVDALDQAGASASFDARARAAAEGMPDRRPDAAMPEQSTPSDGTWEDGDPPDGGREEPEWAGSVSGPHSNPWLNVGRPATHAAGDGGGAEVPPDGPGGPDGLGDDSDDDPDDDEGVPVGPEPAGSDVPGESDTRDIPSRPSAPPRDDKDGNDEDRPDAETKELKPQDLELEPDVERMRGANMARAGEAQQVYEAARELQEREGPDRSQEGRDQERDVPGSSNATDQQARVNTAALGLGDASRATAPRVSDVTTGEPGAVQGGRAPDLGQDTDLGKDMGLG
ncbi:hypothetical protein ACFVFH_15245 [Streptomyces sp. NPDC057697]|uniref:hypothetical protein n=1 Tax=Streptomyces sp. NPDC057697 TaxID=3346219 RepID=UPI0036A951FB